MRTVDRELDRILTLLQARMRDRGFSQVEVQEILGWGRSYISQLVHKNKSIRVEQVLMILNVIGVRPEEFWAEIYQFGAFSPPTRARQSVWHAAPRQPDASDDAAVLADLHRSRRLLEGVVTVLTRKNLITAGEFDTATNKFRQTPRAFDP